MLGLGIASVGFSRRWRPRIVPRQNTVIDYAIRDMSGDPILDMAGDPIFDMRAPVIPNGTFANNEFWSFIGNTAITGGNLVYSSGGTGVAFIAFTKPVTDVNVDVTFTTSGATVQLQACDDANGNNGGVLGPEILTGPGLQTHNLDDCTGRAGFRLRFTNAAATISRITVTEN